MQNTTTAFEISWNFRAIRTVGLAVSLTNKSHWIKSWKTVVMIWTYNNRKIVKKHKQKRLLEN